MAFPTLAFYGLTEEQRRETVDALAQSVHVAIRQAWDNHWNKRDGSTWRPKRIS